MTKALDLALAAEDARLGVVVPVRNGGRFLANTLSAVEAQTCRHWTGVVVVNASTDDTLDIARAHAARDPRWRVVEADEPGVSRARNLGRDVLCEGASPAAIWWLDADDVPEPDLLTTLLSSLRDNPDSSAVHGRVRFIDDGGNDAEVTPAVAARLDRFVFNGRVLRRLLPDEPTTRLAIASWPCIVTPGVVLARMSAVRRIGDWNTSLSDRRRFGVLVPPDVGGADGVLGSGGPGLSAARGVGRIGQASQGGSSSGGACAGGRCS